MPVTSASSQKQHVSSRALRAQRRAERQETGPTTSIRTVVAAAAVTGTRQGSASSTVTLAPRRRTRTSLAAWDAAAMVSSEKPKRKSKEEEEQDPSPPKKARTVGMTGSDVARSRTERRYNLRSTSARNNNSRTPATITPATAVKRQINFDSSSCSASSLESGIELPDGVVDIYLDPPKKVKDWTASRCQCPADVSFVLDTTMATQHLVNYGREFTQGMLQAEHVQLVDLFGERALDDVNIHHAQDDEDDLDCTDLRYRYRFIDVQDPRTNILDFNADTLPRQPFITTKMRTILVNWLVEMGAEYAISDLAFHLSVTLLDGILARGPKHDDYIAQMQSGKLFREDEEYPEEERTDRQWEFVQRNEFQALGCACTWIASKMEDRTPPSADDFVYISDHSFSSNKLRSLERRICRQLSFNLHRVTPMHYLNQFLRASHACPCPACQFDHPVLRQMVLYLIELSRVSFDLSFRPPSLIAAAAVYLGRATLGLREVDPNRLVGTTGYWTKTLEYTTGYSLSSLENTALLLHKYHMASESTNTNASFVKYKKTVRHGVSLKVVPRIEDLDFDVSFTHDDLNFEPDWEV